MNTVHTLKGVLNTIGLGPAAQELHLVEDFLEGLAKAPILPPMRAVANLLLKVRTDVRKNLGQAKQGWIETSLPRLEARIARVLLGARGKADASVGAARGASAIVPVKGASVHSLADARSQRSGVASRASNAAAGASQDAGPGGTDRKFIRVGTERLDALMNLAGELVVSRSRLLTRVGTLKGLQGELGRGSRRLVDAVDDFRDTYEYASLDGKSKLRLRDAPAAAAPAWESFGELELDRYEDIHILSRRLAEIVSDVTELSGQLARGLSSFTDESQAFDAIVTGIQSEVSRARMVPLDLLFSRLRLPVRDAATRDGKEVRVATEGAEVTLDKTVSDGLFVPMLHLVRNAVVHGIEPTAARRWAASRSSAWSRWRRARSPGRSSSRSGTTAPGSTSRACGRAAPSSAGWPRTPRSTMRRSASWSSSPG
jgi:chemosensory pili system protein ChpA (sensor histidine kinase/response regulator)